MCDNQLFNSTNNVHKEFDSIVSNRFASTLKAATDAIAARVIAREAAVFARTSTNASIPSSTADLNQSAKTPRGPTGLKTVSIVLFESCHK